MTAITDPMDRVGYVPDLVGPSIVETYWGYIIREEQDRFDRESVSEAALRYLGLVLLMTAYVQWLLPASLFTGDVFLMKAGLSVILGALGVVLYWHASRGLSIDVHVDTIRREMRVSHRDSRGKTRLHSVIPMRRIEGAFVEAPDRPGGVAKLLVQIADCEEVLNVATGPEHQIAALDRRLSMDLRPMAERLDERLASVVPFRSRRAI